MISDGNRDYYAGALVAAIGLGAAIVGSRYSIGTLTNMGPGFMPTALGTLLIVMGAAIALTNTRRQTLSEGAAIGEARDVGKRDAAPDWRGWGCIIFGILCFILLTNYAGLVPATFFCVFISARGDRSASWTSSLFLAAGITAFGTVLFSWILGVQMPLFRGI